MRKYDERNYQVTWEDLEAWLEQLQESHGVLVNVTVELAGIPSGHEPVVRVVGRRWRVGTTFDTVFEDYKPFNLRSVGQVEHLALHMVSMALLTLDNEASRAQQQQSLFLAS